MSSRTDRFAEPEARDLKPFERPRGPVGSRSGCRSRYTSGWSIARIRFWPRGAAGATRRASSSSAWSSVPRSMSTVGSSMPRSSRRQRIVGRVRRSGKAGVAGQASHRPRRIAGRRTRVLVVADSGRSCGRLVADYPFGRPQTAGIPACEPPQPSHPYTPAARRNREDFAPAANSGDGGN